MQIATVLLSTALFVTGPRDATSAASAAASGKLVLTRGVVGVITEAKIPAQEAGVLSQLTVNAGSQVKKGQVLGQIDDTMAQAQVKAAKAKLAVAKEEASSNVGVDYAAAANKTAMADYQKNKEVSDRVPGAVPHTELLRLMLKCTETALSIDKAKMDKRIAGLQANVSEAEVEAAAESLKRHQMVSTLDGVVDELYRHEGEWVQPTTDPNVMRIVQLDQLWVIDRIKVDEIAPSEIQGRRVVAHVKLTRGRVEAFEGTITMVSPTVINGQVEVRATIENRMENGSWLVRPGMMAEMTIDLR